jgi:UDP-3-O-[3-hydroxymyristoyl] glucosamine N-acyltransferase
MVASTTAGDPRFFLQTGPHTLDRIAAAVGADVEGGNMDRVFRGVAPLQVAGPEQISFLDNRKYIPALVASVAGAVIVHPDMRAHVPAGCVALVTREPYAGWARVAALFHPIPPSVPGIHLTAVIDPTAIVDASAQIDAYVVIGRNVEIGAGCAIGSGTSIGDGVQVGAATRIGAQCTISHAVIGKRAFLFPGVRVGQEGFGFATVMSATGPSHLTVPQLGRVMIEDDVEIGANTTIDRGSAHDTRIGAGTRIDNLVQIGHNVQIGRACVVIALAGISGSAILEDFVVVAGQVGIAGHKRIGRAARIGAQAGVMNDVPAGEEWVGSPAEPAKGLFRQMIAIRQMVAERASARLARVNNPAPGASASGPAKEAGLD